MEDEPRLLTAGRIASSLGVPLPRVLRVLATRPHIKPAARAGILRLYRHDAIELVRRELESMEARRMGRGCEGDR